MIKGIENDIANLRKEGKTYSQIKEQLGCSKTTIAGYCRKLGISDPNLGRIIILSEEEIDNINKVYEEGNSIRKTAKLVKRSAGVVRKFLKNIRSRNKTMTRSQSVVNWRKRVKLRLIEYKGGKCKICGYDKCVAVLTFHHLEPLKKDFAISGKSRSYEKLKEEVDKCLLVCSNCHIEIHQGLHGGVAELALAAVC